MKRCPECRRDYYDDTLIYCLDDGNALLEGPASADDPAIVSEFGGHHSESPTRPQIHTTDQTAIRRRQSEVKRQKRSSKPSGRLSPYANRAAEPKSKRYRLFATSG